MPLSMVSNSASSGAMSNNTGQKGKGGSGGGGGNSNSSSARMIFQASQRYMKKFTTTMIATMYNIMHIKNILNKLKINKLNRIKNSQLIICINIHVKY